MPDISKPADIKKEERRYWALHQVQMLVVAFQLLQTPIDKNIPFIWKHEKEAKGRK